MQTHYLQAPACRRAHSSLSKSFENLWQACGLSPLDSKETIEAGQILVYALPLSRGSAKAAMPFLSNDEQARAARFGREIDSQRFVISRGLLRCLLGFYTGIIPGRLVFHYGPRGRPELSSDQATGLDFNLARQGDHCVIALGKNRKIGIDIESCNSYRLIESVTTMFGEKDLAAIERIKGNNRSKCLIEAWTALEARAKAMGVGIDEFVTCDDRTITYKNFKLGSELIGCVAAEGSGWHMKLIKRDEFDGDHT